MTEERLQKAELTVWISIVGNLGLAIMKGVVGYIAGSKALLADALLSASNVAASFAVLSGLRAAPLPGEEGPTSGRGKPGSTTVMIMVSVLLLLIGVETALSSFYTIYRGISSPPKSYALAAIIVAILFQAVLYQYKFKLGHKLSSQESAAYAREYRSGLYASIAVLAGVGGAALGDYLGNNLLYYLDPIAGLFVSALILRLGYRFVVQTVNYGKDSPLREEDTAELLRTVQNIKGVIQVDNLRALEQGHYVIVDVKISVNPRISVLEGHDVAKTVKHTLMKRFIHVSEVYIHVNPYDPGYPYKNNVNPEQDDYPSLLH